MSCPPRAGGRGLGDWLPPRPRHGSVTGAPARPGGWQRTWASSRPRLGRDRSPTPPSRVLEDGGTLYFDGADIEDTGDPPQVLHEVEPGLFFTEIGEALDFRTDPPTFRNLELRRVGVGPAPPVRAVLAICGLVMLVALLAAPGAPSPASAASSDDRGTPAGTEAQHGHRGHRLGRRSQPVRPRIDRGAGDLPAHDLLRLHGLARPGRRAAAVAARAARAGGVHRRTGHDGRLGVAARLVARSSALDPQCTDHGGAGRDLVPPTWA